MAKKIGTSKLSPRATQLYGNFVSVQVQPDADSLRAQTHEKVDQLYTATKKQAKAEL